jgi:hypothetical protein
VTALPAIFQQELGVVPEAATIWLLLASVLGMVGGSAHQRRRHGYGFRSMSR